MTPIRNRLERRLSPLDNTFVEAAAGGERQVAFIRLWFYATLVLVPLTIIGVYAGEVTADVWVGLVAGAVVIVASALILFVVRRGTRVPGLAYWTSAFDVTVVSLALVACALVGRPMVAVNSMVLWEIYLLAILATSLRFDIRVCLFAGILSILQYAAILWWVTASFDVYQTRPDTPQYGHVMLLLQFCRLFLQAAATGLAAAIVVRTRRLLELSGTDTLTGLANRFYFEEHLGAELARSERTGRPLTVVFIDLDHFKQFNDSHGHDVGDKALRLVARVLVAESRRDDLVARWGGEEFVLVCSGCDRRQGQEKAERIRARLAQTAMPAEAQGRTLTVSAGIASWPDDGRDGAALLNVADRRMLAAKKAGRDRVVSGS